MACDLFGNLIRAVKVHSNIKKNNNNKIKIKKKCTAALNSEIWGLTRPAQPTSHRPVSVEGAGTALLGGWSVRDDGKAAQRHFVLS